MINLLYAALSALPKQNFQIRKFIDFQEDSAGLKINRYSLPQDAIGNIQAVNNEIYKKLGLDFEKNYLMLWSLEPIKVLNGQNAPDMILIDGKAFKPIRELDWYGYNGWTCVLILEDKENGKL
jgi:hypothetical protein